MIEDKVARICWNANGWQYPSGRVGKVTGGSSTTYESKTGYGHEEWLFDISKLIDGFHYAYIQAIGQHRDKYVDQTFNISFYTINSLTKERWWLGAVGGVSVVPRNESKKIYEAYEKRGWLSEMYVQLAAVGADVEEFKRIAPGEFCCIKYRPRDMMILEEPRLFSSKDPAVKSDYYNLKNSAGSPKGIDAAEFVFVASATNKKGLATATYSSQTKKIDLVHNQIQAKIVEALCGVHGASNVSCEQETGYGTKIDIAIRSGKDYIFYELKTASTSKQCIREGLSQLMEYAYYPARNLASKLVVVGLVDLSSESRKYLGNLRAKFALPVYYRKFDLATNTLGSEE